MSMRYFHSAVMILALLAASCTKENLDNCYQGLDLRFTFTHHTNNGELFGEKVNRVGIYLFDEQGVLQLYALDNGRTLEYSFMSDGEVKTISTVNTYGNLPDQYTMHLDVPEGRYQVLSWAGSSTEGEPTFFHGQMNDPQTHTFDRDVNIGYTRIEDLRMFMDYHLAPDLPEDIVPIVDDIDDLWYGAVGTRHATTDNYTFETVEIKSGETTTRTIELIRNTNILKVTVTGIQYLIPTPLQTFQQSQLELWAVAKNGRYKYDNSIGEYAHSIRYTPYFTTINASTIAADIKVLRMDWENHKAEPILLYCETPDGKRYPEQPIDVVNTLLQARDPLTNEYIYNSQSDFDKIYEHPIEIRVDMDLSVSIYVHGWKVINIIPGV